MAEEAKTEEGKEESSQKKKISPMTVLLGLQILSVVVAAAVIVKFLVFSQPVRFEEKQLTERAIASITDNLEDIRTVDLDVFTLTLPDKKTLKIELKLEVSNSFIQDQLQDRLPAIKSRILNALSEIPSDQLRQLGGKLLLKDNVRRALNEELRKFKIGPDQGIVREVLVSEFFLM